MEYDKARYLELLKQDESLKKKGIWLYEEDREAYLELLKYQVRLSDQKYWENRQNYFSVMTNFINGNLTAEDFTDEFLCLWENDRDRFDKFDVNCELNIASKGFAGWMNKIFSRCEVFEPEAEKDEEYNEKWLKDSISNVLIQIQKEYNSNENAD
jgi:hypothetical protein